MVEIGAGESNRGSDGDGVSAAAVGGGLCDGVIPLVGSAALMVGFQLSFVSASDLVE